MKFTHLIEINNLGNPMIAPLTRSQLWHGLVLRAERPTLFLIGLDSCEITSRSAEGMSRTLHFGKLEVIDEVRLTLLDQVHRDTPETTEESFYNDFRRNAYKESDIDTVRMIRQLADEGQLDSPIQ